MCPSGRPRRTVCHGVNVVADRRGPQPGLALSVNAKHALIDWVHDAKLLGPRVARDPTQRPSRPGLAPNAD